MGLGIRILLLIAVITASAAHAQDRVAAPDERAFSAFSEDKHRQFDFWIGEWDVNLRMIQDDLTFADKVKARAHIYSILHGKAILEFWDSVPIKGYSLRYFDEATDEWVLWLNWPQQNQSMTTSLRGSFRHGRGNFLSEFQTPEGETIIQRYSFNDITPFSLRWDDLFSSDGGKSWQKNWRMELSRTAVEPEWPLESLAFPTHNTGARCDDPKFRPYEVLPGHWHGEINGSDASVSSWHALDGCAVIVFLDIDSSPASKRFMFITYETVRQRWVIDYLDDNRSSGLLRLASANDWANTSVDGSAMKWTVDQDRLEYRFESVNGEIESGQFERQDLQGH